MTGKGVRKRIQVVLMAGLAGGVAWGALDSVGVGRAAGLKGVDAPAVAASVDRSGTGGARTAGEPGTAGQPVRGPADPEAGNRLLVVFKSGQVPAGLVDALSAQPGVKVTPLPDIGAVAVKTATREGGDAVKRVLTARFGGDVDAVGADPILTLNTELNRPVGETLPLSAVDLTSVQVPPAPGAAPGATSPAENVSPASAKLSPAVDKAAPPATGAGSAATAVTTGSSVDVDGAVLYQQWGWDIQEVTENGKSFAVQPGNHRVKVAVIDSGIDPNHPDLRNNIVSPGRSFVPGDPSTADDFGHGTMVAGTIAADGLLLGVGPHLGIVPYRVFQHGDAQSSWVIQAIVQAVKDGADVINLSLGTYKSLKNPADRADLLAYQKAVAYALVHGVTVVASSGTDGVDIGNPAQLANQLGHPGDLEVHAPGGLPGVLTTAATNRQQARAYYSNYGRNVDLAAPGGDFGPLWDSEHIADVRDMCLVTYPTNLPQTPLSRMAGLPKGYEWMIGTSLAAPKVAAAAALVIAQERDKRGVRGVLGPWTNPANPVTVRNILERTAVDVGTPGRDPETGAGVVDAAKALQAVR